jgi:signal transduction histidine kinase
LLGWAALVLGLLLLMTASTSLLLARPMRRLLRQIQQVGEGTAPAMAPLAHPGIHEIDQLSRAFGRMAETLAERAEGLRSFAAQVSHELKTPLTAIQGTVELFRDHLDGMSRDERERFLGMLEADTDRMSRLVRRLLELARAEVAERPAAAVDAGAIWAGVIERARVGGLDVTAALAAGPLWVRAAPESLETVLSALLDNARQHGGPGVHVEVEVARAEDGGVRLGVSDDGPGFPAALRGRIFEPFATGARERGGTGLGLAIVAALVKAHRGRLERREGKPGAALEVWLPLE